MSRGKGLAFLILASCAAHIGQNLPQPAPITASAQKPPLTESLQTPMAMSNPIDSNTASGFFLRQRWEGGYCWGSGEPRPDAILHVTYDYTSQKGTTQTTVPSLAVDAILLGKDCHADATLIVTNLGLFILPGAISMANSPIEDRTWWPYTFDIPLVKHIQLDQLKVAFVFEDGSVYIGQVLPKEKDIKWKLLGNTSTPLNISEMSTDGDALLITFQDGKKEKFSL